MRTLSALVLGISVAACPAVRADTPAEAPVKVPFEMLITRHIAVKIQSEWEGPLPGDFRHGRSH